MSEVDGRITRRHMWYGGASWDANDQIVALILRNEHGLK